MQDQLQWAASVQTTNGTNLDPVAVGTSATGCTSDRAAGEQQ